MTHSCDGIMQKVRVEDDVVVYRCNKCGDTRTLPNVRVISRVYCGKVTG
jgi:hypothetical protein